METRVPSENHRLPQVTGNILTCHGWDSNLDSGERQLAVSGNALDHTARRAGPQFSCSVTLALWYNYDLSAPNLNMMSYAIQHTLESHIGMKPMYCKVMFTSKVSSKSIFDPEDIKGILSK